MRALMSRNLIRVCVISDSFEIPTDNSEDYRVHGAWEFEWGKVAVSVFRVFHVT
jgi:hypothetical protein